MFPFEVSNLNNSKHLCQQRALNKEMSGTDNAAAGMYHSDVRHFIF